MLFSQESLTALALTPFNTLNLLHQHPIHQTTSCPQNPPLSCSSNALVATQNTCCTNSPGGLLLQTQFWDTHPATGPSDSWTIHGLWPDNCDGSYESHCDSSRHYTNITSILSSAGAGDLLSYMKDYWTDQHGRNEIFWEHEWNKHGTCISTLHPECYASYSPQQEVVDFFNATVTLFQARDSYSLLERKGIVPDANTRYPVENVLEALGAGHEGVEPYVGCTRGGELNEIWYFFETRGSLRTGEFVASEAKGGRGRCPHLVRYLPKDGEHHPPGGEPGEDFSGRGMLNVEVDGNVDGCLISKGTWFRSGTCAKFTAEEAEGGFVLKSRRGKCYVRNGAFGCGGTQGTVFQHKKEMLRYNGSTGFWADEYPSGGKQAKLRTDKGAREVKIVWQSV